MSDGYENGRGNGNGNEKRRDIGNMNYKNQTFRQTVGVDAGIIINA